MTKPAERPDPAEGLGLSRVGDALDRVLGHLRAPSADVVETVFGRWSEIVGAAVAEHARPVAIEAGQLTVAVDDPAWASELRWLESKVLERIAEVSGTTRIEGLSIRVESRRTKGSNW